MCLTISVELEGVDESGLRSIVEGWPEPSLVFRAEGKGFRGRHQPRLTLHACGLLSDAADWNAATWAMTPEGIKSLTDLWVHLFERVSGDVTVQALWEGDLPKVDQAVTRAEFMDLVGKGALGTKTRYLVQA